MMAAAKPRPGLFGYWDRLVGPGMTPWENALVIGAMLAGGGLAALHLASRGQDWQHVALGAVIGADVIGGAVCNMTETTKRWYHRQDGGPGGKLRFTSLHLLHVLAVAWAFRGEGLDAAYLLTVGGWLIASVAIVQFTSVRLSGPVATILYAIALGLSTYGTGQTPGLEWFVPFLFMKLLIGHALPLRTG